MDEVIETVEIFDLEFWGVGEKIDLIEVRA